MGTAIASYRRPTNAVELLEVVRTFLQAEFGVDVWGLGDGIGVDLAVEGAEKHAWVVIGEGEPADDEDEQPSGPPDVPPAAHPLDALIRAAIADYRERLRTDFKPRRIVGSLAPLGELHTHRAKLDALSSVEAILHRLVVAAHGGGWDDVPDGAQAVEVDGALIVVVDAEGADDGFPVHVVELSNVVRIGREGVR